ncbi:fumarylacetoacetate hydrolase family protein [Mycolicibacterium sp. 624]|uniref:2-keto-4-pentenoate hydratase n=1 Tax=Mycolicibacterium sp. 624 TaxID=3156314 RepID=UPI00339A2760
MTVSDIAARLDTARHERLAIAPFSDADPGFELELGYRVQHHRRLGRPLAGWKLGLTAQVKQRQVGVDTPLYGFLDAADRLSLGQPLPTDTLIAPRAEPEIVFILGDDLAGPHITSADVLTATAAVAAGIEILDSRYRDYRFRAADLAADNVSAGRYLVGPPRPPRGLKLDLLGAVLTKNGDIVATAAGAAVMGHPAAAVAWLARRLHDDGEEGLRRGQVIFSGGLTAAVPVAAGDTITVDIGHLGRIAQTCT